MTLDMLLIEDDQDLAATVIQFLNMEGIRCDHAGNGLQGLTLASQHRYDVILLDLNLPRLDGISLCQRLRLRACTAPRTVALRTRRCSPCTHRGTLGRPGRARGTNKMPASRACAQW